MRRLIDKTEITTRLMRLRIALQEEALAHPSEYNDGKVIAIDDALIALNACEIIKEEPNG